MKWSKLPWGWILAMVYVTLAPIVFGMLAFWPQMPTVLHRLGSQTTAAWVQGIGSLLAICAAIGIAQHQAALARRDAERRAQEARNAAARQLGTLVRIAANALEVRLIDDEVMPPPEWIEADDFNEVRHESNLTIVVKALQRFPLNDLDERLTTTLLAVTALAKSAEINLATFNLRMIGPTAKASAKSTLIDLHERLSQRDRFATDYISKITKH
jgi:hypothetical protein